MNVKKWLIATIVVGVVVNVYDVAIHGWLLRDTYMALPDLFRQEGPLMWFVIGDFVLAGVLAWFYDRVYSSFGGGLRNGAVFGLYVGVLLGFPVQLFAAGMFVGFPYSLAWTWVFMAIGWGLLAGAVTGAIYGPDAKPAT